MNRYLLLVTFAAVAAFAAGCSDDNTTPTDAGSPFNRPDTSTGTPDTGVPATDSGTPSDAGTDTGVPACSNKPAGCFCGTPTTQKQFLNRCTTSAALPFNITFKAGTAADLP